MKAVFGCRVPGIAWVLAIVLATYGCESEDGTTGREAETGSEPSAAATELPAVGDPIPTITAADLLSAIETEDGPVVLDVRTAEEFDAGHVRGAINIPYDQISAHVDSLAPLSDRGFVVYCRTGHRAGIAETTLRDAGFESVWDLEGHMVKWQALDLPLVVPVAD